MIIRVDVTGFNQRPDQRPEGGGSQSAGALSSGANDTTKENILPWFFGLDGLQMRANR